MIKEKIKNLFSPEGSLQEKTLKSGIWSLASRVSLRGLTMLKLIIVAMLLSPNDIGLLGVALLTIAILEVFTKTGFKQSLIQNKEDIKGNLDTAWTIMVLRGLALFGALFVLAPYVATFFEEPGAEAILQVIGLVLVFKGLKNIGVVFFEKELEFQKKFVLDLSKIVPSFVITVWLAFVLRNVWALIYGTVAGAFVFMIVSYMVHPYKPSFEFDFEKASDMFGFGKWIMASSIILFFLTQGDDIFVGKVLGVTALGFYQLAYRISNAPATEISHTITRVIFPAYSKIQDNIKKLRSAFKDVFFVISFITFPISFGIISIAPEFTYVVLGDKWAPIIIPMQILSIWGLIRALGSTAGPIFKAIGKPHLSTKIHVVELVLIASLIYPFTLWKGLIGISTALVISIFSANLITFYYVTRETKMRSWNLFKYISIPLFNSGVMLGSIILFKNIIEITNLAFLVSEILFGALVYISLSYFMDKYTSWKPMRLIKEIWTSF